MNNPPTNPPANPANFQNAYLGQQIHNASPAQQLVMLLDGTMKFVMRACECIEAGDIQERHNNGRRAMDIIAYLMGMIDVTTGGEPAIRLRRIYGYLMRRVSDIDFKNDVAVCDEIVGHLRTMRDAWANMEAPAAAAPSTPPKPEAPATTTPPALPVKRSAVA